MSQPTLFDDADTGRGDYGYPRISEPPLAASADPQTSHDAAESVREVATDQARRLAELVCDHPGLTTRELAHRAAERGWTDLDRYTCGKRASVAVRLGLVRVGPARPSCDSARESETLWPRETHTQPNETL